MAHPKNVPGARGPQAFWGLLLLGFAPHAVPSQSEQSPPPDAGRPPNVLVLLADDLGLEFLAPYADESLFPPEAISLPRTPTLARLAEEGVRFTQARVMPTCSATRASILGGRYPFRHGIGALVRSSDSGPDLAEAETIEFGVGPGNRELTLAHVARAAGLRTLHAGKWHLALQERNAALGGEPGYGWSHVAEIGGFDEHWGIWGNLSGSYSGFEASDNGELVEVEGYATSVQVDRILGWTGAREDQPWLVYSAFNAVHAPFELPPPELVQTPVAAGPGKPSEGDFVAWRGMVEALDRELGRLLDGLEAQGQLENTLVIFIGDNGSPERVMKDLSGFELGEVFAQLVKPRQERFKHTVWECGVRVPLLVRGPGVDRPGRSSEALVDAPDLLATVAELLGVDLGALLKADSKATEPAHVFDGVSFLDVLRSADAPGSRGFSFVEHFAPNGNPELIRYEPGAMGPERLIRRGFVLPTEAGRFKLVRNWDHQSGKGRDRLFQLSDGAGRPVDPWEQVPLSPKGEHRPTLLLLKAKLDELLRSEPVNWTD